MNQFSVDYSTAILSNIPMAVLSSQRILGLSSIIQKSNRCYPQEQILISYDVLEGSGCFYESSGP